MLSFAALEADWLWITYFNVIQSQSWLFNLTVSNGVKHLKNNFDNDNAL